MNKILFSFLILFFTLCVGCEKSTSSNSGTFYTNAIALQNDSSQQFNYSTQKLGSDSLYMKFQAMVNFKDTFGNFEFLIPLPTTKDTIWLNDQSHYTYSTSNLIGDIYTINNQSSNYVLFETNSAEFNSSNGIFQAQFIIDTLAGRIDTLSPDTVSLKNGLFSGSYLK